MHFVAGWLAVASCSRGEAGCRAQLAAGWQAAPVAMVAGAGSVACLLNVAADTRRSNTPAFSPNHSIWEGGNISSPCLFYTLLLGHSR